MAIDQFTERLAKIRTRFAANLYRKIDSLDHALPQLSGEGDGVVEALATAHRSIHELCGMGPTVGFVATGRAARSVERILIQSVRAKRGMTAAEIASVRQELAALRDAARIELQTTNKPAE
jgi:HPt (histidine-containing phosphotransfer) domain-containing protein